MYVVFIHGLPATGKRTVGTRLSELTGLPLFHNHLAVDAAMSLFDFGTPQFNKVRATIWRTAFQEAAAAGRSFIFTFAPDSSVEPSLIEDMAAAVHAVGGKVHFVELVCSKGTILQRLGSESRTRFGKLTDPVLYETIESTGGFRFLPLPEPLIHINTEEHAPEQAAEKIVRALRSVQS